MFTMNCPLPIYDATATLGNPVYIGFTLNYTLTYGTGGNNATGTYFQCYVDPLSNPEYQVNLQNKNYGETLFGFIPYGWLGYLADTLTVLGQRITALFTLISFFISPTNFNILGYTIADISGIALMFVIAIYALCYISVGAWLYKTFSPFSGVG